MIIRPYKSEDYDALKALQKDESSYGGQFDPDRDGKDRLDAQSAADPESVLVAEVHGEIVGTVSLIVDQRVAWLFRYAVRDHDQKVIAALYEKATEILRGRGHLQVLVYSPSGDVGLDGRYEDLGFTKGGDYTCFWKEL